jgi:hypothetical protein
MSARVVVEFCMGIVEFLEPLMVQKLPKKTHVEKRYSTTTGKPEGKVTVVDKEPCTVYQFGKERFEVETDLDGVPSDDDVGNMQEMLLRYARKNGFQFELFGSCGDTREYGADTTAVVIYPKGAKPLQQPFEWMYVNAFPLEQVILQRSKLSAFKKKLSALGYKLTVPHIITMPDE